MKIFDFSKHKKLYVCGDIHGEFKKFFNEIRRRSSKISNEEKEEIDISKDDTSLIGMDIPLSSIRLFTNPQKEKHNKEKEYDNSIIIVAGDISLGFNSLEYYKTEFAKINELLAQINTFILFVRGNHDDPSFFSEDKLGFSNIKTVPDYGVVLTEHYKTLCVGGSISYDRTWRQERSAIINKYRSESQHKKTIYWENEKFVFDSDKLDEILKEYKIDSVVTHTYPRGIKNIITKDDDAVYWFEKDPQLETDILFETENVKNLINTLEKNNHLKFWASGHVHVLNLFIENDTAFLQLKDDYKPLNIQYVDVLFEKEKSLKNKKSSFFPFYETDDLISTRSQIRHDSIYNMHVGQVAQVEPLMVDDFDADEITEEQAPF